MTTKLWCAPVGPTCKVVQVGGLVGVSAPNFVAVCQVDVSISHRRSESVDPLVVLQ